MGTLLLGKYIRLFNWVARKLENLVNHPEDYFLPEELTAIQKLYLKDRDNLELAVAKHYPDIHPALVQLLITKLDGQGGCLNPMDRLFSTLMS